MRQNKFCVKNVFIAKTFPVLHPFSRQDRRSKDRGGREREREREREERDFQKKKYNIKNMGGETSKTSKNQKLYIAAERDLGVVKK